MRIVIQENYTTLSKWVAEYVADKINAANPTAEKPYVMELQVETVKYFKDIEKIAGDTLPDLQR